MHPHSKFQTMRSQLVIHATLSDRPSRAVGVLSFGSAGHVRKMFPRIHIFLDLSPSEPQKKARRKHSRPNPFECS